MAQSGYTPIELYYSSTATNIPLAADLNNGELALNIADGKLYFKNNSGVVTLLANSGVANPVTDLSFGTTGLTPSTSTSGSITVAGILNPANGGTGAATLTGLVLGNGTSAMTTVTAPSGAVVGTTDTQTLTNKRINSRVQSQTTQTLLTINSDNYDEAILTAQVTALSVAAPTGTPVNDQKLIVRIYTAASQTLSWTTSAGGWRIIGTTLPSSTLAGKTVYIGAIYNANDNYWDVVGVAQQL